MIFKDYIWKIKETKEEKVQERENPSKNRVKAKGLYSSFYSEGCFFN